MPSILDTELDSILEGTSRSFYLSLKELPQSIRQQVSLLYMLARTSDTIADSEDGDPTTRLLCLEAFNKYSQGKSEKAPDLSELAKLQTNPSEGRLLVSVEKVASIIDQFSESDQNSIRRCLGIIIGGQIQDLERFSESSGSICSLEYDSELDDYAYRVAGSVGEFWTRISLDHQFEVDHDTENLLFEKGVRFGKALQMINILRDIPSDLSLGRCYIPRRSLIEHGLTPEDLLEPENMEQFKPLYAKYLDITESHLDAAVEYIGLLPHTQFRLRGACMLPVVIGKRTTSMLRRGNVLDPDNRIKIDRSEVKSVFRKVVMAIPFQKSSKNLLEE
ncbi:MAG: farnesyl-diphosphate farnesyltransferase [Euryarchaeota archaeon]|nr:farnesyl-diphosphate farnesyltransferase [Euryarchaeota archaeon]|tara:strand:- start:272 stop:1270 length:999 start_codon:yes stop_codon:yes gene_type:complete